MGMFDDYIAAPPMSDEEAREWLAARGIPEFVDEFIGVLIKAKNSGQDVNNALFMDLLKEVLDRNIRKDGKGTKAIEACRVMKRGMKVTKGLKNLKAPGRGWGDSSTGGGGPLKYGYSMEDMNVPAYCRRDPTIRPSQSQVERQGVTTWKTTRSKLLAAQLHKDYASTVAGQFNYGAQKCIAECQQISAECKRTGKPFFDKDFWFGSRDTMYPKGVPADCTVTEPKKCMRAKDLYPGAGVFSDGACSNDIIQGAVGDCFFIGAASALASCTAQELKPLQRLFVHSDVENGIYGVMWFKNGGWEWVIVDDWLAVTEDGRGNVWPQYACPGDTAELWPLIIEKAYAKIHYCWDSIDGGWARQALEDLTGGMGFTLDLNRQDKYEYAGQDFKKFKALCDDNLTILGCAVGWHVTSAGGAGRAGESGAIGGLYKGHAYSIIKFAETSDGTGFVRVRNPWGNDAEWTGAYADNSREWRTNPSHARELNPEFKDDGAFWMCWNDFRRIFTDIDVVRFFPYEQVVLCMFGTAPRVDLRADNTYIVQVGGSQNVSQVNFSLGQDDTTCNESHHIRKKGRNSKMCLSVYSLDRLPKEYDDLQEALGKKINTPTVAQRTVFTEMCDLKPGYYSLVPKIYGSGTGFYLRVFASAGTDIKIWRYSEGEASALHVNGGASAGTEVPAVAVPTVVGGATADVPDVVDVPAAPVAPDVNKIYKIVGCDDKRDFEDYVTKLFSRSDTYSRGKLSERQAENAFSDLLCKNENARKSFDKAWSKVSGDRSSYYTYCDLPKFKTLVDDFASAVLNPE